MPLFVQNREVGRVNATAELFDKYPHLQENGRTFRSKPLVDVDLKCLLYVQQREFAAATPEDNCVSILGSDDATTCHLVVLRHTGSGAVCLAHCDGSSTWSEVPLLVKAVTSLSNASKEGRLELHLVGGFNDESKTSHKLSLNILAAFHKQKEDIHLETCCITEINDIVVDGTHRPVIYGIGVNVKTGDIFPASFTYKGPAEELRSARTFTGGQMVDIYDSSRGHVKIGPCKWSPNLDIAFWLSQDDDTILKMMSCDICSVVRSETEKCSRCGSAHLNLDYISCHSHQSKLLWQLLVSGLWTYKYLSTSPMAEPPHFVQHMKSTIQFLLEHPNSDSLFPGGQPQLYHRTESGDWERIVQP